MSHDRTKSQTHVIPGSLTGASVITHRIARNDLGLTEYVGEAPSRIKPNQPNWIIQRLAYDQFCEVERVEYATNMFDTMANTLTVDTSDPLGTRLTIDTGTFRGLYINDCISIRTDSFNITELFVEKVDYGNELSVIVKDHPELFSTVDDPVTEIIVTHRTLKDPDRRIWDLREHYLYG